MIGIAAVLKTIEHNRKIQASLDRVFARQLRKAIEATETARWSGRGGDISLRQMSDSHVLYALAKGYRGEYSDGRSLHELQCEAFRRLLGRLT